MEVIKKKIQLVVITGTSNGDIIFLPDTSAIYNIKLLLNDISIDFGFFNTYEDELATGVIPTVVDTTPYTVTGESTSRLNELEKFTVSTNINIKYFTSTSPNTDGLNVGLSTSGVKYIYYIGGITYVDTVSDDSTVFNFLSTGYSSPDFENFPIIKDEKKQNIITNPIIDNNVFITRQETSVFENNYRLRSVAFLTELDYYAGGAHFNILNNT